VNSSVFFRDRLAVCFKVLVNGRESLSAQKITDRVEYGVSPHHPMPAIWPARGKVHKNPRDEPRRRFIGTSVVNF
jgi:hypothetical protein